MSEEGDKLREFLKEALDPGVDTTRHLVYVCHKLLDRFEALEGRVAMAGLPHPPYPGMPFYGSGLAEVASTPLPRPVPRPAPAKPPPAAPAGPGRAPEGAKRELAPGPVARERQRQGASDAPFCDQCGSLTVRNGTCYRCLNCGTSMGCS